MGLKLVSACADYIPNKLQFFALARNQLTQNVSIPGRQSQFQPTVRDSVSCNSTLIVTLQDGVSPAAEEIIRYFGLNFS
jgi:hypothetical protein